MRFRYYLRGIGLGILFATIVLTISVRVRGGIMTDERAVMRAEELGYVLPETENADKENGNLSGREDVLQGSEVQDDDVQENVSQDDNGQGSDVPGDDGQVNDTQDISAVEDSQHDNIGSGEFNDSGNSDNSNEELITIIVKKGDNCRKLSERLLEAGLVADAEDFRLYMFQKKYDSLISAGTYEIPYGADYDDIAKVLIKELRE